MGLYQIQKHSKGNDHQSEEIAYRTGEKSLTTVYLKGY
jgi:hypothetical protein